MSSDVFELDIPDPIVAKVLLISGYFNNCFSRCYGWVVNYQASTKRKPYDTCYEAIVDGKGGGKIHIKHLKRLGYIRAKKFTAFNRAFLFKTKFLRSRLATNNTKCTLYSARTLVIFNEYIIISYVYSFFSRQWIE